MGVVRLSSRQALLNTDLSGHIWLNVYTVLTEQYSAMLACWTTLCMYYAIYTHTEEKNQLSITCKYIEGEGLVDL
jgi:hypothetical protein